ncbi:MAG: hypothetical protein AAF492_27120, partial [Verrucomicrobiota bacterium]
MKKAAALFFAGLFGTVVQPFSQAQSIPLPTELFTITTNHAGQPPVSNGRTGWAFGTDDDILVVGSSQGTGLNALSGSADVYRYDGLNWVFQQKLFSTNPLASLFGYSCDVDDGRIIIGARRTRNELNAGRPGEIHIFEEQGTNWVETATIKRSSLGRNFGTTVDLEGDTFVTGSEDELVGGVGGGRADVYVYNGTNWVHQQGLFNDTPESF